MTTSPFSEPRNRFGSTRREMERLFPHWEEDEKGELKKHAPWIREDWNNKTKCALCGEKVQGNRHVRKH